jgi:hypothetical protein
MAFEADGLLELCCYYVTESSARRRERALNFRHVVVLCRASCRHQRLRIERLELEIKDREMLLSSIIKRRSITDKSAWNVLRAIVQKVIKCRNSRPDQWLRDEKLEEVDQGGRIIEVNGPADNCPITGRAK